MMPAVRIRTRAMITVLLAGLMFWSLNGMAQIATFERPESIGAPFELVDRNRAPVSSESFHGRLMLIFFGYTHCPDVCPAQMATVAEVIDVLGRSADEVAFVLVTIDPARDTPERLGEFVDMIDPRLMALTGDEAQIRSLAESYRAVYSRHDTAGGDYVIDHSSLTYLMGRNGEFLLAFMHGTSPERMAAEIRKRL